MIRLSLTAAQADIIVRELRAAEEQRRRQAESSRTLSKDARFAPWQQELHAQHADKKNAQAQQISEVLDCIRAQRKRKQEVLR